MSDEAPDEGAVEAPPPSVRPAASETGRSLAAVGYPLWIVALIALLIEPYKDEEFVRFHAWQAIILHVAVIVGSAIIGFVMVFVSLIPFVGFVASCVFWPLYFLPVLVLVYQIVLAVKAYNGEWVEVPYIADLTRKSLG